jgi:hypothetical protein
MVAKENYCKINNNMCVVKGSVRFAKEKKKMQFILWHPQLLLLSAVDRAMHL